MGDVPAPPLEEQDRELAMTHRQALLLMIDGIERRWCISPRTAELRQWWRKAANDGIICGNCGHVMPVIFT